MIVVGEVKKFGRRLLRKLLDPLLVPFAPSATRRKPRGAYAYNFLRRSNSVLLVAIDTLIIVLSSRSGLSQRVVGRMKQILAFDKSVEPEARENLPVASAFLHALDVCDKSSEASVLASVTVSFVPHLTSSYMTQRRFGIGQKCLTNEPILPDAAHWQHSENAVHQVKDALRSTIGRNPTPHATVTRMGRSARLWAGM